MKKLKTKKIGLKNFNRFKNRFASVFSINFFVMAFFLTIVILNILAGNFQFKLDANVFTLQVDPSHNSYYNDTELDNILGNDGKGNVLIKVISQATECTTPWGVKIKNGDSVLAYKQRSDVENMCDVERRKCENGVLKGSFKQKKCMDHTVYDYQKERVICYNCKPDNPYMQPSELASNRNADFNTEGKLNGDDQMITTRDNNVKTEKVVNNTDLGSDGNVFSNCLTPRGDTVKHGQFVKAYMSEQGFINSPCEVEIRNCIDGELKGTYIYQSCDYKNMTYEDYIKGQSITTGKPFCPQGYHNENGNCIPNQVIVNCVAQGGPQGALYEKKDVSIFRNGSSRTQTANCNRYCDTGYNLQNNECLSSLNQGNCSVGYHIENGICVPNQKYASCTQSGGVANSSYIIGDVLIQRTINGRGKPTNCLRNCNPGYHKENSRRSISCVPDTRIQSCEGLARHSHWNVYSQITQTLINGQWTPSVIGVYNPVPSNKECRFVCDENYVWVSGKCSYYNPTPTTRTQNCEGLPNHAHWNTVSQIIQRLTNGQRSPSNIGRFDTNPSVSECRFVCDENHVWISGKCSYYNPTPTQFDITFVYQMLEGGRGIDDPKCGTHTSCEKSQFWPYDGRTQIAQYPKPGTEDSCRYYRRNIGFIRKRRQRNITECKKTFAVKVGDPCGSACIYEKDPECIQNATKIIDANGNCVNK